MLVVNLKTEGKTINKLRIGPSGNSVTFYESGHKNTFEAAAWLNEIGLNAYEYSFGRGIKILDKTAEKIGQEFTKFDIAMSVHAPYYTNFSNESPAMIELSMGYIINSIIACKKMGGSRVVFHPASCGKQQRDAALSLAKSNIGKLMERIHMELDGKFTDYIICPETMGKLQQIGRVEEVVDFCTLDSALYPCFDFGHINSYTHGGIRSKDDYRKIIDYTQNVLGDEKVRNMHIHFSKIEYGKGGEVRHLTFADELYGPDYEPLASLIDEYKLTPVIICESKDVMSGDALIMKNFHKNI